MNYLKAVRPLELRRPLVPFYLQLQALRKWAKCHHFNHLFSGRRDTVTARGSLISHRGIPSQQDTTSILVHALTVSIIGSRLQRLGIRNPREKKRGGGPGRD